jgi:hypothetical protein
MMNNNAPFDLTVCNCGNAPLQAFSPVVIISGEICTPFGREIPEDNSLVAVAPAGFGDDRRFGILLERLEPGECGKMRLAGVVPARAFGQNLQCGTFLAVSSEHILVADQQQTRARIIAPGKNDNELSSIFLAPPAAGAAAEEKGYFTIVPVAGNGRFFLRVVDGASYEDGGDSGGSTSEDMLCKVNNRIFNVAPWESPELPDSGMVILKYSAARNADGETPASPESVSLMISDKMPSDDAFCSHLLVGRFFVNREFGYISVVQSSFPNGIPQMWWYLLCQ